MRKEFELTEEDYEFLFNEKYNHKDFPIGVFPLNNLNLAWIELGKKYNFDPYTVERVDGSYRKFTANSLD